MTMMTTAEKAIQQAIYTLWYMHYTNYSLTQEQRNSLAQGFINEHLSNDNVLLTKAFIRHPMTRLKQYDRTASPYDVLADFILAVNAEEEKREAFPLHSEEQAFRHARQRRERETSLYKSNDDDDELENDNASIEVYTQEVLAVAKEEENAYICVEQFAELIAKVKRNSNEYARKYAQMGYSYASCIRNIRKLDARRIKVCAVCDSAFYAHDMRRTVCDQQNGIAGKNVNARRDSQSMCEIIATRKRAEKAVKSA